MAKIKAILNTQYKSKEGFQIVIRVTHQGRRKYFDTGYCLPDDQFDSQGEHKYWDASGGQVKGKLPLKDDVNRKIREMMRKAQEYSDTCDREGLPFVFKNIFKEKVRISSFSEFAKTIAERKEKEGKLAAQEAVITALNSLEEFNKGEVFFHDFADSESVFNYNAFLIKKGNSAGTRRNKIAYCAYVWKQAIRGCGAPKENPFAELEISPDKSARRWLTKEEVTALALMQFSSKKHEIVRDMFLFSFYAYGMRLHNVVRIKKSHISNGRVNWTAAKSKISTSAEVNTLLSAIIERRINEPGEYLFPFLNKAKVATMSDSEIYKYSKSINICVNRLLRKIAEKAGMEDFTFHSARHSFATYAANGGVPIMYIMDMLTHSSVAMTEKYIAGLSKKVVDAYGRQVYSESAA